MASQPANTDISVKYVVRSYRQDLRHNSVFDLFNHMRSLVMSVPSNETLNLTVRSVDSDDDVVTTALLEGRGSGLPLVRGLKPVVTLAAAVAGIANIDFPIRIGRDVFLTKADGFEADDLHAELRAV